MSDDNIGRSHTVLIVSVSQDIKSACVWPERVEKGRLNIAVGEARLRAMRVIFLLYGL